METRETKYEGLKTFCLIVSTIAAIISPFISVNLAKQDINYNFEMIDRNITAQSAEHSKDIKIEILNMIKEMYIGKSREDQMFAIELLNTSLKADFAGIRQVLIASAADNSVKEEINKISDRDIINEDLYAELKRIESEAINNIKNNKLSEARANFLKISELKGDYHNVYEILRELLNNRKLQDYNSATIEGKEKMITEIKKVILEKYSWGLNKNDLANLQ